MSLKKENFITPLLEGLQLSVYELAQYLGMRESNLRHAIAGRRDLTREQIQALAQLDSAVAEGLKNDLQTGAIADSLSRVKVENPISREEKVSALKAKLRKLQETHTEMGAIFIASEKAIPLLNNLLSQPSKWNPDQLRWINEQFIRTTHRLVKNSPEAQLLLQARIAATHAELEVYINA